MPKPPRITVRWRARKAKPKRGAQLLLSFCTPTRRSEFTPASSSFPVARLSVAQRLFTSTGGGVYSYRNPRFNVSRLLTFQSSCT